MKILSIGNSFTDDPHAYFYAFSAAAGESLEAHNLSIGGCSLERHWNNFESGANDYSYTVNGVVTPIKVSLPEVLGVCRWDIVTIQQVSHLAGLPESFEPYLTSLLSEIRRCQPEARIMIQETWEYEYNTTHFGFKTYGSSCDEMYRAVSATYREMAEKHGLSIIPSGDAIHAAKALPEFDSEHGGQSLYRDSFHAHLTYGRYLLACVWYRALLGKSPVGNPFRPLVGESDPRLLALLAQVAERV